MDIEHIIAYLIASVIIVAVPGPNILLIVNDSITHGFRKSAVTAMGIASGMGFLFFLSLAGVTTLLMMFSWLFFLIKWVGVCYFFYLGISQIISSFKSNHEISDKIKEKRTFFTKGFLISVTNPKGLVFAGAFFPQFLNKDSDMISQVIILCGGFLIISLIIGISYALCCDTVSKLIKDKSFKNHMNRISGVLLIFFGIGLAFAREER